MQESTQESILHDGGMDAITQPDLAPLFWLPERLGAPSAWWLHVPFAHWIVAATRPGVLVELGTHAGVSYAAFCQAVQRLGLPTRCHAVDTWQGDSHAGAYDNTVYDDLARYHELHFSAFSTLIRSTFDDAQVHMEDGSIDLLHIDGLHTYEAVRHDFENWRPKLSDRAVVLFHDINERSGDFGVWRFWREISQLHPNFAFLHGHGLGVLAVGAQAPAPVLNLCRLSDAGRIAALRDRFLRLGERWLGDTRERMLAERLGRQLSDVKGYEARIDTAVRRAAETRGAAARAISAAAAEVAGLQAEIVAAEVRRADAEARRVAAEAERDAVLYSSAWRSTLPFRKIAQKVPRKLRRAVRGTVKLTWWSLTLKLPAKLAQRRRLIAAAASPAAPTPPAAAVAAVPGIAAPMGALNETTRLVYISGEPDSPGHLYRVARPAQTAAELGAHVTWMRIDEIPARLGEIEDATALVIWRAPWGDPVAAAVAAARRGGARIVFDVDDLMVDPELARLDVIDGIRTQDLTEDMVRDHYTNIRKTMAAADMGTTTTDELAGHMRAAWLPSIVLPNGVDHATIAVSRRAARNRARQPDDGLIRIGYAGGSRTHQRDFALCADAVAAVLRAVPVCRLVVFRSADGGSDILDVGEFESLRGLEAQMERRNFVPLQQLPEEMARFDVNLAPLEVGNPFCEAKSELKYFEAALVGVPTIASPTGPFRRAIRDGETGFLATAPEQWQQMLMRLVADKPMRDRIAANALRNVIWRFGPERRREQMAQFIGLLRGGRPAATAFAQHISRDGAKAPRVPRIPAHSVVFEADRGGTADVTVVVPLHNYGEVVTEALDSVRAQTLAELDLIIVDDASSDDSLAVATAWARASAQHFNRIAVLRNDANAGLAHTRNVGFEAADTPFVLLLDADNRLRPACLAACLAAITTSGAAFAYPLIQQFGATTNVMGTSPYNPVRLTNGNYIDAMALVSRAVWAAVGGYDHVRHGWEDFDFWCRIAEQGLFGVQVPGEPLAEYRVHATSMIQTTMADPDRMRSMIADLQRRHPWLTIVWPLSGIPEHPPAPAVPHYVTASSESARLDRLLPLLRCPLTGAPLSRSADGEALVTADGSYRWPLVDGRPALFPGLDNPAVNPDSHVSNKLPASALAIIRETRLPVLHLSAGGTAERFDHVVEAEAAVFRHTDLLADVHKLPFADASFEAVIALNAFEHYRDPRRAAAEILRVLRPGGRVLIRTAFLQPLHEAPWHFYNCTRYGLETWFEGFDTESLHVSPNFHPGHSIAWLASECEAALRGRLSGQAADALAAAPVGQLVSLWRTPEDARDADPLWRDFAALPQDAQEGIAAGFEFIGRRPPA